MCGLRCVRYPLIFTNILIFVMGAVLLGLGIGFHLRSSKAGTKDGLVPQTLVFVAGGVMAGVATWGALVACWANACCLKAYKSALCFVLVGQAAAGVIFLVDSGKAVEADYSPAVEGTFAGAVAGEDKAKQEMDRMQSSLECCGPQGPLYFRPPADIPDSCCTRPPCTPTNSWAKGCTRAVTEAVRWWLKTLGIIFLVFAGVELIAVFLTCCAACIK